MDDWDTFKEKTLPPIEIFFSKLNKTIISKRDYNHAKKVWKEFNCKTLGNYHDLYLKTDIILLADVSSLSGRFVLRLISWIHASTMMLQAYRGILHSCTRDRTRAFDWSWYVFLRRESDPWWYISNQSSIRKCWELQRKHPVFGC